MTTTHTKGPFRVYAGDSTTLRIDDQFGAEGGDRFPRLGDAGRKAVAEFLAQHGRSGLLIDAFCADAEQARADAKAGEDVIIELAAQYADDHRPHTLALRREWFE